MTTQASDLDTMPIDETPKATVDDVAGVLRNILADGIDIHRCASAQALGGINTGGNVDALVEALLDEDEDVRTDAATSLGQIGDKSVEDLLLKNLLGDPSNDVKGAAIDSLINMKAENIIPWLRRLILSKDEEIVWDDGDYYENGWDDWVDIQLKALKGLGQVKDVEAIPLILEAMKDEFAQDMEEQAFPVFTQLGAEGIEALGLFLESERELTRNRAILAISKSDDPAAEPFISKFLKDQSPAIRLACAEALFEKSPKDTRLTEIMWDSEKDIRLAMLKKLGAMHADWTIAQLDENDLDTKRAALTVIANTPDAFSEKDISDKLQGMLEDVDSSLEGPLLASIAGIDGADAIELLTGKLTDTKANIDVRLSVISTMEKIGNESVASLIAVLGDSERPIRLSAMAVLVKLAKSDSNWPNEAGEALLAASRGELVQAPTKEEVEAAEKQQIENKKDDEDLHVRETMQPVPPFDPAVEPVEDARMAAMAEAEREVAQAEEALNPSVRPNIEDKVDEAIVDADNILPTSTLGMILADENAAKNITVKSVEMTPLNDNEKALYEMSKNTLKNRKIRTDTIIAPHIDVKFFAAKLLGDLSYSEVALALSKLIRNGDKELRLAALDSLSVAGRSLEEFEFEIVQPLLMTLNDPDRDIRMLSIRALASAPGKGTANLFSDLSADTDSFVRIEAARALGQLPNTTNILSVFLKDDDVNVRLAAADALSHVGGLGAVKLLVDFIVQDGAKYARDAGRMLQGLDVEEANGRLLEILADENVKMQWLSIINALDVLNSKNDDDMMIS